MKEMEREMKEAKEKEKEVLTTHTVIISILAALVHVLEHTFSS